MNLLRQRDLQQAPQGKASEHENKRAEGLLKPLCQFGDDSLWSTDVANLQFVLAVVRVTSSLG